MRRASVSIGSNLAEGSTRKTDKDRVRFILIAYGSLMELLNQFGFVREVNYVEIREKIENLSKRMSLY